MNENQNPRRLRWPRLELRGSNGLGAVLLLGLLSSLLFFPYVRHFESRDAPDRIIRSELPGASTLEGLEYRIYDSYFVNGEENPPALRDRMAIIAIDQNSLNDIGQWPWPRQLHARLIRRLHRAGARVIAMDIEFASRQNPGPQGQLSKGDRELVAAVAETRTVVLPSWLESTTGVAGAAQKGLTENDTHNLATPFGEDDKGNAGLDEATPDLALSYLPYDGDGGARRYPLAGKLSGSNVGSFAALTCALYQKLSLGDEESAYETALRRHEWFSLQSGKFEIPTRIAAFRGTQNPQFQEFLLKYRTQNAQPNALRIYSYSSALNASEYDDAQMKRLFNGKIVFIGATAPVLKDLFPAPGGGQISGVELHAGAACQLLEGSYIQPPEEQVTLFNLFGMAMLSALWPQIVRPRVSRIARRAQERWKARKYFKRWRFRVQDTLWFFLTGGMALLPALCFWSLCHYSFYQRGVWTVIIYPLLASVFAAALTTVYLFTLETAERRKVMRQIGLYLDPDIMETILAYPEEDYPRPRRTTATVMFTDLQQFTSYSENHEAEDVVAALNDYMSRLQPIVKRHFGVVDKYIGDAIMSYFGVPVPRPDHALWALRCAIEIQEECARFRAETGIPFYTRIGLHTGELIAGSIGSQSSRGSFINYTVIGDTVNLASRLEAKNKEFGSWILCSRVTVEAAPDLVQAEPVSDTIRGKSQEVEMFIVRGWAHQEPRDGVWGAPMPADVPTPN